MIKKIAVNILFLSALLISLICLLVEVDYHKDMEWLFLLPATYTVCIGLSRKKKYWLDSPGIAMFNVITFIRFCIGPLTMVLTNRLNVYARNYDYLMSAIIVMCVELVAVFFVLNIFQKNDKHYDAEDKWKAEKNRLFVILMLVCGVLLLYLETGLLGSFDIITIGRIKDETISSPSNLILWIWRSVLTAVMIYTVGRIKAWKQKEMLKVIFSLLICMGYLTLIYIGQTTITRWYLVVSVVAIYFFLIDSYPLYKYRIMLSIIVPALVVVIIASITKNTQLSGDYDITTAIDALITSTNMDTYFAGPVSVNNAIGMKEMVPVGFSNLFYDVLNNFPGISRSIDKTQVTAYIYNDFIFGNVSRGDQIIPLVGQSMALFTSIFAPFLSVLSIFLVIHFDSKYRMSKDTRKYCYAFTAVWLSLSSILNMTIIVSWVYIVIVPLYILLTVYHRTSAIEKSGLSFSIHSKSNTLNKTYTYK